MTTGILFDVDGTLVDSNYLHAVCWHDALRSTDHLVAMNVLHRAIGMGSSELLSHVLGDDRDKDEDGDIIHAHKVLYQRHWSRLTALPDAEALLRACAGMGHRVVLASSAAADELAALRRVLDADDLIDGATSSSDVDNAKPEPDLVQVALDKGGFAADSALFVGDSVWDAAACKKADVTFIGLTCGGTSAQELTEAGAIEVWRDPAELLENLKTSAIGKLRLDAPGH
ncbi:MAG: HAD family hydrolase [Actinomycetota bacterium]|nr:HAD family hydrolase [Actinomycetota bacterium]